MCYLHWQGSLKEFQSSYSFILIYVNSNTLHQFYRCCCCCCYCYYYEGTHLRVKGLRCQHFHFTALKPDPGFDPLTIGDKRLLEICHRRLLIFICVLESEIHPAVYLLFRYINGDHQRSNLTIQFG